MDAAESEKTRRKRLHERVEASHDDARALVKDAHLLINQSRVLQAKSAKVCQAANQVRARKQGKITNLADVMAAASRSDGMLTVLEACLVIGICERTLRRVMKEPEVDERLIQRNHRAGIFYKWVLLLPPELVFDLKTRFEAKKKTTSKFVGDEE